jgi:hypothetical protein
MAHRRGLGQGCDRQKQGLDAHLPRRLGYRQHPADRADQSIQSHFPVGSDRVKSASRQTTSGGKKGKGDGKIQARTFLA